jgi:FimV-like protein
MAIPVRNTVIFAIVLLCGICPLWAFAADQPVTQEPLTDVIKDQSQDVVQLLYGPVGAGDTLAGIAIKLKGDGPWHYHRWMYALYKKNPQAFFGNNINNLKLGATLLVPGESELEQIDQGEAFRAVKVHLYELEQERQEREQKPENDEEVLLRARLQRLFSSNQIMQQESSELFDRIAALEQQMGSVVDRVLETEGGAKPATATVQGADVAPAAIERRGDNGPYMAAQVAEVEHAGSSGWWAILLGILLLYAGGFFWRRRLEAAL